MIIYYTNQPGYGEQIWLDSSCSLQPSLIVFIKEFIWNDFLAIQNKQTVPLFMSNTRLSNAGDLKFIKEMYMYKKNLVGNVPSKKKILVQDL